jgi:type IV secretory pathway VirB10-like protein
MSTERIEWGGLGAALLFHAVLIGALSLSLARIAKPPEPPAMEVDFVTDEVALEAVAPTAIPQPRSASPPAPSEAAPVPDAPTPAPPVMREVAVPRAQPQPRAQRPARPQPQQPQRRQGLGDDFLSELGSNPAPSAPAAPTYSAAAKANVASSIASQAQRCANRQPYLGEGADEVVMYVSLNFARSGRLVRPPQITRTSGPADARARYGELLEDQVRRIFADCAPFRLPADLYDTGDGGWKVTTLRYRVKK